MEPTEYDANHVVRREGDYPHYFMFTIVQQSPAELIESFNFAWNNNKVEWLAFPGTPTSGYQANY
jgi:hypothetical protein